MALGCRYPIVYRSIVNKDFTLCNNCVNVHVFLPMCMCNCVVMATGPRSRSILRSQDQLTQDSVLDCSLPLHLPPERCIIIITILCDLVLFLQIVQAHFLFI